MLTFGPPSPLLPWTRETENMFKVLLTLVSTSISYQCTTDTSLSPYTPTSFSHLLTGWRQSWERCQGEGKGSVTFSEGWAAVPSGEDTQTSQDAYHQPWEGWSHCCRIQCGHTRVPDCWGGLLWCLLSCCVHTGLFQSPLYLYVFTVVCGCDISIQITILFRVNWIPYLLSHSWCM